MRYHFSKDRPGIRFGVYIATPKDEGRRKAGESLAVAYCWFGGIQGIASTYVKATEKEFKRSPEWREAYWELRRLALYDLIGNLSAMVPLLEEWDERLFVERQDKRSDDELARDAWEIVKSQKAPELLSQEEVNQAFETLALIVDEVRRYQAVKKLRSLIPSPPFLLPPIVEEAGMDVIDRGSINPEEVLQMELDVQTGQATQQQGPMD